MYFQLPFVFIAFSSSSAVIVGPVLQYYVFLSILQSLNNSSIILSSQIVTMTYHSQSARLFISVDLALTIFIFFPLNFWVCEIKSRSKLLYYSFSPVSVPYVDRSPQTQDFVIHPFQFLVLGYRAIVGIVSFTIFLN